MTAGPTHPPAATHRQPPAAERARTIAALPHASLHVADLGICRLGGATTTVTGEVLLVVPTDGAVTTALGRSSLGDVPARLTVTDRTPLPLRHPVRGLVHLSGWVTPVDPGDVGRLVLEFADAYACDSLLDVGRTATLVRLDVAEVLLEEAGGSADVDVIDFVAARPDAVSAAEDDLMSEQCRPLSRLSARVQHRVGRHDDVRLLGLDRFGVRFRVESGAGCYDLRVPFPSPLDGPTGFPDAVARLLTCEHA